MKHILLSTYLAATLLVANAVFGQTFSFQSSGIPDLSYSAMDLADYDGDGDLDMIVAGAVDNFEETTNLYENVDGTYLLADVALPAIRTGVVLFVDIDADGDQDVFLSGESQDEPYTGIFVYQEGFFMELETSLAPFGEYAAADFGDYDQDGDLDLIISGGDVTKLYNFQEGVFTEVEAPFADLDFSTVAWVDYDNDGDLDLSISGDSGALPVSKLYSNKDGVFTEVDFSPVDFHSGDMAWGDYDNDGDKDLAIVGFDEYLDGQTLVYRNDGGGAFKNIGVSILGVSKSSADWGDVDNDGDLDLLVSGSCDDCGVLMTSIFRNDNGSFNDIYPGFQNTERGDARYVDYDNDGDLDVMIVGQLLSGEFFSGLYRNNNQDNTYHENEEPNTVSNLSSDIDNNVVMLSWDAGHDDYTPQNTLTYNVRVGTVSGGNDVINAMCTESGSMLKPGMGNADQSLALKLMNLDAGTYYWSVQTVDNQYQVSEFSEEESFTLAPTSTIDLATDLKIFPNPFEDQITITVPADRDYDVTLHDITGRVILKEQFSGNRITLNAEALREGVYMLQLRAGNEVISKKIMK